MPNNHSNCPGRAEWDDDAKVVERLFILYISQAE